MYFCDDEKVILCLIHLFYKYFHILTTPPTTHRFLNMDKYSRRFLPAINKHKLIQFNNRFKDLFKQSNQQLL